MDLVSAAPLSLQQAIGHTPHEMLWRATLQSGAVILEQPGLSSDHLPREEVVLMEYLPAARQGLPTVSCKVDVEKGERFVRYWTTIWRNSGGTQRIYVVGVENSKKFALLAFYPNFSKIVVATTKPFQPPWEPNTFSILPPGVIVRGGPGATFVEWVHDGFGARIATGVRDLNMAAIYE